MGRIKRQACPLSSWRVRKIKIQESMVGEEFRGPLFWVEWWIVAWKPLREKFISPWYIFSERFATVLNGKKRERFSDRDKGRFLWKKFYLQGPWTVIDANCKQKILQKIFPIFSDFLQEYDVSVKVSIGGVRMLKFNYQELQGYKERSNI